MKAGKKSADFSQDNKPSFKDLLVSDQSSALTPSKRIKLGGVRELNDEDKKLSEEEVKQDEGA